jgi:hypothetical protein
MEAYGNLSKSVRLWLELARVAEKSAQEFRDIAADYRAKAAELNGGKLPAAEHD